MVLEFSEEASPALPAASAIVVRRTYDGLETLLLKRSDELKHMPGLWVFPGGKVEVSDEGETTSSKPAVVLPGSCRRRRGFAAG